MGLVVVVVLVAFPGALAILSSLRRPPVRVLLDVVCEMCVWLGSVRVREAALGYV